MQQKGRHKIYDAIVERLADHGWHDARELEELTHYPEHWLAELRRDPRFEVDTAKARMRLLPGAAA